MTANRAVSSVSRNDPCPCGSGRKFKKCCMASQSPSAAYAQASLIDRIVAALEAKHIVEAVALTERLKEMRPDSAIMASIYNNIGTALHENGQCREAMPYYQKALDSDSVFALAYFNRGMSRFALGEWEAMWADFDRALTIDSGNALMHRKLAIVYHHQRDYMKAIDVLKKSLALQPDSEDAWVSLADSYYKLGDYLTARVMYERLARKFPHNGTVKLELATLVPHIAASNEEIDTVRAHFMQNLDRLTQEGFRLDQPERQSLNFPFYQGYHGRDNTDLMRKLSAFYRNAAPHLCYTAPHCKTPWARKPRIRVGMLSEYFNVGLLNNFYKPIIETLSRDPEFEVVLLSASAATNEVVERLKQSVHRYVVLPSRLPAAREAVARETLDILIYLEVGMSPMVYFLAHARLAPIQCVMSGHPITTGIPVMDYYFSSRLLEPENAQEHYTETLVLVDDVLAVVSRKPVPAERKSREELGLPVGDHHLYCCPVMLFKLHPDMDRVFEGILMRDPKALIVLFDSEYMTMWRAHLEQRFRTAMPEALAQRIRFVPFARGGDFFHCLRAMDAIFDTLHFSFGLTAYLLLGAEVPFVTWPGEYLRGRVAVGLYKRMSMDDLVADNMESYIGLTVRLATDKAFYRAVSEKIRAQAPAIFDNHAIVAEYAALLKALRPVSGPPSVF